MNLKYLNLDEALQKLEAYKAKWGLAVDKITNDWKHLGVVHVEISVGTGSITIGWERFKKGHIAMYIHCFIPKHEEDVVKCLDIMDLVLRDNPGIEVQYDGDYERNYNGGDYLKENGMGKVYDPFYHKLLHMFKCKHPLDKINDVLREHRGTLKSKWVNTNMRSPIDYDFHFQKL